MARIRSSIFKQKLRVNEDCNSNRGIASAQGLPLGGIFRSWRTDSGPAERARLLCVVKGPRRQNTQAYVFPFPHRPDKDKNEHTLSYTDNTYGLQLKQLRSLV